ncbi:hypothetical protein [Lactococcus lactis]|jgi:hypothetical protein|uniref:hypothetical protein n=1 Tax=Lactococcus lactis TaxID=1358 RepID=UPI0024A9B6FA|nr:hypothetical protein [Lactococcus lactis]
MTKDLNLTFHHIGKPVSLETIKQNKDTRYSSLFDMYTLDIKNDLSLPVQLHAFGPSSSLDKIIQKEAHVAFKVTNIKEAIKDSKIIMPLYEPFSGYQCAMILVNNQPIELIETNLTEREIWGDGIFKDSILYPSDK